MNTSAPLLVACFCAQWCGSCRDYVATFDAAAAAHGAACRFIWIDIEDEAALVDGVEVENFPTLLIAQAQRPLFFGPITPQPQMLARLVSGALAGDLAALPSHPELDAITARLQASS